MTPPTSPIADGPHGEVEPILPPPLLALRDRLLRPIRPEVAARHVAAAAAEAAEVARAPRPPQHLKPTIEELTPGLVARRATRHGARMSAVAAAVVLSTAGLAAAQILPAPATKALSSVIGAFDIPVPWSAPAEPAPLPPPPPRAKATPAAVPDEPRPTSTTEEPTTTSTVPTTSTTEPTTSTTEPTTSTTEPTTSTTVPGDDDDGDDGTVGGTEEPTTSTTVPDDDGTVAGTEIPTGGTSPPPSTTSTTVAGDDGSGGAGA